MFRDKINRVVVDGQSVEVAEKSSTGEILESIGKNSRDYNLVTQGKDGISKILPGKSQVRTRDGQKLETVLNNQGGSV